MPLVAIRVLDGANYAFTVFFVVEMTIKLMGLGVQGYVSDNFNVFDGVITILSVVQMTVQLTGGSFVGISALRALRVFRLFRYLPWLKRTMSVLLGSLQSAAWIAFLLILYLFIVGLLGSIVSKRK